MLPVAAHPFAGVRRIACPPPLRAAAPRHPAPRGIRREARVGRTRRPVGSAAPTARSAPPPVSAGARAVGLARRGAGKASAGGTPGFERAQGPGSVEVRMLRSRLRTAYSNRKRATWARSSAATRARAGAGGVPVPPSAARSRPKAVYSSSRR